MDQRTGIMEKLEKAHARHKENMHGGEELPWRAWGSWFSWGSPVGLGLGFALFIIPLGVFITLLHQAGIIK